MRVVQLLNWKLKTIESILDNIEKQGFDAIQINPIQPYKEEEKFYWWSSYQPLGFSVGNCFGTEDDLKNLCYEASKRYIDIIVDVVFNHMANSGSESLKPHSSVDVKLKSNPNMWKQPIMLQNGDNRYEAVNYNIGLPGLNYKNEELQHMFIQFLERLRKLGVKGFKFDSAKHIGLPSDGVNFLNRLKHYLEENNLKAYGEFIGGDFVWRNEFTNYMDILTNYSNKVSDTSKHISFIESHNSYLNNDYYTTRNIKMGELNNIYGLLTYKFPKTLYYVRQLKKPYFLGDNSYGENNTNIGKLNELNYFDTSFLNEKRIREANLVSNKVKVYVKN